MLADDAGPTLKHWLGVLWLMIRPSLPQPRGLTARAGQNVLYVGSQCTLRSTKNVMVTLVK